MTRPSKLAAEAVTAFLRDNPEWHAVGSQKLAREYRFPDYGTTVGFVVRLALAAEKKDHHPDIELGFGRARVVWSTHDAGGLTELDLQMAKSTDEIARRTAG
jgi:4a-hydroxytetrahydrobiopterin dehydratase